LGEALRGFGKCQTQKRDSRGQHEIKSGGNEGLVLAINFAEATLRAVAVDGVADGGARGDHAHAGVSGRTGRPDTPSEEKDAAIDAAALLANSAEIGVAPQALTGGQAQGGARCRRHAEVFLDDRKALAALAAAVGEDLAAAFGGFAGAETDFAGAF